jgi:alpha-methylacyl-CoA racemase
MPGPLSGIKILEFAGIGPGPWCAMLLADMGAEVVRIDRLASVPKGGAAPAPRDILLRGRPSIAIDLKNPKGTELALTLVEGADAIIEGFRPGVMEGLGLGPDVCLERNPRLIYGRMTGWGQDGPIAHAAGHDINYIALTGALHSIGRAGERPVPPLNLVGDFGGGGLMLAFGIAAALVERATSGKGQVIDAAMTDGASLLMAMFHSMRAMGAFSDERGTNLLDTGAHFYNTYETADGKYVCIGSIEPQFYAELLRLSGLDKEDLPRQNDRTHWPSMQARLVQLFKTKTRDEWSAIMEGTDVCFAPVLSIPEAYAHHHNVARNAFLEVDGVKQPAPAPRFSRTPGAVTHGPVPTGSSTGEVLADWGLSDAAVAELRSAGAIN